MEYSVITPDGVIRPILPLGSVNQTLPSGPAVIPLSRLFVSRGRANSVTRPDVVTRTIPSFLVTHRLPSGPLVIPLKVQQYLVLIGKGNFVITPEVVLRPTEPSIMTNQMPPSGPAVIAERPALGGNPGAGNSVTVTWAAQTAASMNNKTPGFVARFGVVGRQASEA